MFEYRGPLDRALRDPAALNDLFRGFDQLFIRARIRSRTPDHELRLRALAARRRGRAVRAQA